MTFRKWAAIGLALLLPTAASAHRTWLLPSSTVLSGDDIWVSVDAAASNELFYFDHNAMGLEDLAVTAPDGSSVEAQHQNKGRYRSTFDVQLTQQGTYKLSIDGGGLAGTYMLNGERKRWRGPASEMASLIPQGATDVEIMENYRRIDTFVTLGAPSETAIAPSKKGLEFAYDTHPNDLFAGETAKFRLLMNGKPMPGIEVSIIPGGNRYRDELNEVKVVTGKDGGFEATWPEPGMYWLNAEIRDEKTSVKNAKTRRASYTVTLEVLPQ